MYDTPVARPSLPVVTSRTMASVTRVSLPVRMAGGMSTPVLLKLALTLHPRPHCPQKWHGGRLLSGAVSTDMREAMQVTFCRRAASFTISSQQRGLGAG